MRSGRLTALGVSAAGVSIAFLATACSVGGDTGTTTPMPQETSGSSPSSLAGPPGDDDGLQTLGPLGELTPADLGSAHERAVTFLRAFAATDQPSAAWWADLQPLLSPAAAQDYSYVDPAGVPALEVQSAPVRDLPGGSPALLQVQVTTSRGDYVLTLTRTSSSEPWLVARCDPPGEAQ